jgi:hypothetical protein
MRIAAPPPPKRERSDAGGGRGGGGRDGGGRGGGGRGGGGRGPGGRGASTSKGPSAGSKYSDDGGAKKENRGMLQRVRKIFLIQRQLFNLFAFFIKSSLVYSSSARLDRSFKSA